MKRDLLFVREYPHPVERVWHAVTDSACIAGWLMPNDFAPVVGHRFQFRTQPQGGWDGIVDCEVLTVDPPRELAYSWRGSMLDTVLTLTLEPTAAGTRLRLAHTGFRGARALLLSLLMGSGWGRITGRHIPAVLDSLARGALPQPKGCGAGGTR
jgi:uncharacterized protein YndB with AHSA1/START domain